MAHTYKDIDYIVGIKPYSDDAVFVIHFKNGTSKEYTQEPKFTDKFYDNHTEFAGKVDGKFAIAFARFTPSWEDPWTDGETTREYYDRVRRETFDIMKVQ